MICCIFIHFGVLHLDFLSWQSSASNCLNIFYVRGVIINEYCSYAVPRTHPVEQVNSSVTDFLTPGTLGTGHEFIPFVTLVQIQVLTVLCVCFFPIPFLSSLSPPPHALLISSDYLFLHSTSISASVSLFYLPHSLHLFPLSICPPASSLHRPLPLVPSSNSCRPSTFPSMLPRGCPWPLTPLACLTRDWLWGAALGCWPFPGPSGPSWPLKMSEPILRLWQQRPQPNTTEV